MSASTGPNAANLSSGQDAAPSSADRAALQADLEERLAAARVERAKVLAAKGRARKKPAKPVAKPSFLEENAGAAHRAPFDAAPETPNVVSQGPTEQLLRPHVEAPHQAVTAPVAEVGRERGFYISPTVMIAFACFFGLGFGGVLSLGVVIGLGWVSLDNVRGPQATAAAPVVSEVAPDALGLEDVSQLPTGGAVATPATEPNIASVVPGPVLSVDTPRDDAVTAGMRPGPQVDTTSTTVAWTQRPAVDPAAISVAFDVPSREALASLPARATPDTLPAFFERGPVHGLALTSKMPGPVLEAASPSLPGLAGVRPQTDVLVALFDVDEDMHPRAPQRPLARPALYTVIPAPVSPLKLNDTAVFDSVVQLDQSPRLAPLKAALSEPVPTQPLPQIGGPVVRPKALAAKLGYVGEDLQQITLFTYAPASVKAQALDETLEELKTTGFPLANTSRVNFRVSKTHVRYYTRADEAVAHAIAAEVGGAARDFTREKIGSPSGRIEVWMAGTRVGAPRAKPTASTAQRQAALRAQKQVQARTQLKSRLVNSLKRKDYLR